MRRNPSTVVVMAGQSPAPAELLATVGRSMNVSVVRPDEPGGIEAAAGALRRAAGISSPYVLVAADPLAEVAEQWRAMWDVTRGPQGGEAFELRAAEALAAWRADRFQLPDYYLVLAEETEERDFYGQAARCPRLAASRPLVAASRRGHRRGSAVLSRRARRVPHGARSSDIAEAGEAA